MFYILSRGQGIKNQQFKSDMLMLQVDRRHSVLATYNCQDRPESSEKKPSMEEFPELEWPVRMSTRDCLNHKLLSSMSRWS